MDCNAWKAEGKSQADFGVVGVAEGSEKKGGRAFRPAQDATGKVPSVYGLRTSTNPLGKTAGTKPNW